MTKRTALVCDKSRIGQKEKSRPSKNTVDSKTVRLYIIDAMTLLLTTYRKRDDFSMDELVAVVGDLIRQAALPQGRWKVTEMPDPRTVRYYMSTGILDKPTYEGSAARFSYRHILQLLAIKALQSQYLPLRKIQEILEPLEEKELEKLLKDVGLANSSGGKVGAAAIGRPGPAHGSANQAREKPPSKLEPERPQEAFLFSDEADRVGVSQTWERLEVEPGLELQIRSDFRGAEGPSRLNVLLSKIRSLLEGHYRRHHESE